MSISRRIYLTPMEKRVIPWFRDEGDKTLRLNYDLDENSVVLDLGGYEGQWASDIFSRYCCFIHVFEPTQKFADQVEERFKKNPKVLVHCCALSPISGESTLFLKGDSTSVFGVGEQQQTIRCLAIKDFFHKQKIESIQLMKINIEGGEYDLLEHLLDSGLIEKIENIQVQFHDFVPNAAQRMAQIQVRLQKTHILTFQYSFIWENWKSKKQLR